MLPSFDLCLLYYHNPQTLHHWLARLLLQSNYMEFADISNVLVADTGTPVDRIPETLEVLRRWKNYKRVIYVRANTEAIRAAIPPHIEARPSAAAINVCIQEISRADIFWQSCLGQVFNPHYFREILAIHARDQRVLVQPKQFRLHSPLYHQFLYDQPFETALQSGQVTDWNGLPDPSVRREHLMAIGNWDEAYVAYSMVDIDFCSRLTGLIDFGTPAHEWHKKFYGVEKEPYANYGLSYAMPCSTDAFSLICNEYSGHTPYEDHRRHNATRVNMEYYVKMWGIIPRNLGWKPISYQLYDSY